LGSYNLLQPAVYFRAKSRSEMGLNNKLVTLQIVITLTVDELTIL